MTTLKEMQRLVEAGCEFKMGGYRGTKSKTLIWTGHIVRDGNPDSRIVTLAVGPGELMDALVHHASTHSQYADLFSEAPTPNLSEVL